MGVLNVSLNKMSSMSVKPVMKGGFLFFLSERLEHMVMDAA